MVFTVCGELDKVAAAAIDTRGFGSVDGVGLAIVDMSEVTVIDSAGMRCVEHLEAMVSAAGARFELRDPSPIVRHVVDALRIATKALDSRSLEHPPRRTNERNPNDNPVWVVAAEGGEGPAGSGARPSWSDPASSGQHASHLSWTLSPIPVITARAADVEIGCETGDTAAAELWSALHGVPVASRLRSDRWAIHERVNDRFAGAIRAACGDGDTIWIHDYRLLLTPVAVRSLMPDVKIGFSLHTSFDAAAMSMLSRAEAIGRNLAACDLIGVQTLADADQLDAFLAGAGIADAPPIMVSPTSIDPHHVLAVADRAAASPLVCALEQRVGTRDLITAVDNLDPTAAIVERIAAYDLALRLGVLDPHRVHIVQIVNLGKRQYAAEHHAKRVDIERRVHAFNATWTATGRHPMLETHFGTVGYDDTLAILRRSRLGVVTPTRAGMGTMAKEFAVLAQDTGGVLVMSDRAGAAA